MKYSSIWKLSSVSIALMLASSLTALATTYKCVNKETGQVSFSDRSCDKGNEVRLLKVRPTNTADSSVYQREPASEESFDREHRYSDSQVTLIDDHEAKDRGKQDFCRSITPGPRGYTAKQQQLLAQCAGLSIPSQRDSSPDDTAPISALAPAPAPIVSCDPGGCWDSQGLRYARGAGDTYFPTNGGPARQLINGQMQ